MELNPTHYLQETWGILQQLNLIPIITAAIIVIAIYVAIKKILAQFRSKGFISRGTENAIRFITFAILALMVIVVAVSSWLQVHIVAVTFVALLIMFVGVIVYAIRTYVENAIAYILFVSSNIVKDGDNVRIYTGSNIYEGRIDVAEGGYAIIDTGDSRVYIPYSTLLKSVITKMIYNMARFKIRIKGQSLELEKVISELRNAITKEIKVINRENIDIRPIEVRDDEVVLSISLEVPNPRNINECYETLAKLLMRRLPYKFSLEFID